MFITFSWIVKNSFLVAAVALKTTSLGGWVVHNYTDDKAILAQLDWSWLGNIFKLYMEKAFENFLTSRKCEQFCRTTSICLIWLIDMKYNFLGQKVKHFYEN